MRGENVKNDNGRISIFDSLKGIAICGIIMVHSNGGTMPGIIGEIANEGKYGVQLFFIISAFFMFASMERSQNAYRWIAKKIVTLAPMYYLALMFALCVFGTGTRYWLGSIPRITFMNVLTHMLFLHIFFPHYCDSIIGVEWYIGALVFFYALTPVIHKYINSLEKALIVFLISPFLSFEMDLLLKKISIGQDGYIWWNYVGSFFPGVHLTEFFGGIVLYYLVKGTESFKYIKNKIVLSYELLFIALVLFLGEIKGENSAYRVIEYTWYVAIFGLIIIGQLIYSNVIIDNSFWRVIGKNSYSIYLFHFPIIEIWRRIYGEHVAWIVLYITVLCSSFLLGFLVEKFFNKPFVSFLIKKMKL